MKYPIKVGIIGGSGLDDPDILSHRKETTVETPYGSPSDCVITGEISGVPCVLLARHGRKHTVAPHLVNYRANIWALKLMGCTHVLVSTACGSLQESIKPGDLVLIDSFIDRTRTRQQTFYGPLEPQQGICHLPMTPAFCENTRKIILDTAKELKIPILSNGTCITIEGPRFSSQAESRLYNSWGAHVINMTTVPEVVLAKEAGLCYAAIGLATDYDSWRSTPDRNVCVADVMNTFKQNCTKLTQLIIATVPKIAAPANNWDPIIDNLKEVIASSIMGANK